MLVVGGYCTYSKFRVIHCTLEDLNGTFRKGGLNSNIFRRLNAELQVLNHQCVTEARIVVVAAGC